MSNSKVGDVYVMIYIKLCLEMEAKQF